MLQLHRITCMEDPFFPEAFELYQASFPVYEQRTREQQRAILGERLYHFDVILEDRTFAGILLHWRGSGYAYIEHLAVHPTKRGGSIGSRILEDFCRGNARVVLEIDPPDTSVAVRRKNFYTRIGFLENTYSHTHPPYIKGASPHALVVMSFPAVFPPELYRLFCRELSAVFMRDIAVS